MTTPAAQVTGRSPGEGHPMVVADRHHPPPSGGPAVKRLAAATRPACRALQFSDDVPIKPRHCERTVPSAAIGIDAGVAALLAEILSALAGSRPALTPAGSESFR